MEHRGGLYDTNGVLRLAPWNETRLLLPLFVLWLPLALRTVEGMGREIASPAAASD